MTRRSLHSDRFILEAFDRDQWCTIAQAPFHVDDISSLRALLGVGAGEDDELQRTYYPDDSELAELAVRFGVGYDRSELVSADVEISLFRSSQLIGAPYLVHTGYELPLLLDGRKKLAHISHCYPPMTFDGEDRFDHWVAKGVLHRTEIIEPFEEPVRGFLGHRTVFYTPRGEEWRIPARQLIWDAASKSGGWNEYFERLDGTLLGYEDWQNDWWIDLGLHGGGFGGARLCCPVTQAELAWIEAAGFRALPPVESSTLLMASYDVDAKAELHALMLERPDTAAVVRFNVLGRYLMEYIDLRHGGPWHLPAERIPELNSKLRGLVAIVARRDDVAPSDVPMRRNSPRDG